MTEFKCRKNETPRGRVDIVAAKMVTLGFYTVRQNAEIFNIYFVQSCAARGMRLRSRKCASVQTCDSVCLKMK